jgi:hypothetical protein
MKITVLTDKQGEIIGTARNGPFDHEVQVGIAPGKGQTVHRLDVPEDLARMNAAELHKRLVEYLPGNRRSKSKGA